VSYAVQRGGLDGDRRLELSEVQVGEHGEHHMIESIWKRRLVMATASAALTGGAVLAPTSAVAAPAAATVVAPATWDNDRDDWDHDRHDHHKKQYYKNDYYKHGYYNKHYKHHYHHNKVHWGYCY
jgi:hypothetical protein